MSVAIRGGETTASLSDQGFLSTASYGMQYMTGMTASEARQKLGFDGDSGGGAGARAKDKPKNETRVRGGYNEGDEDIDPNEVQEDDDESFQSDDDITEQLNANAALAGGEDEEDYLDENAAFRLGKSGSGSSRRPRVMYKCDIHSLRITNIACRRRDVLLIMTLGAEPGLPGASSIGGNAADDEGEAAEADEDGGGGASSRWLRLKRLLLPRRKSVRTSRQLVFKSDVASNLERNATAELKKKFSGKWSCTHRDLGKRVLHLVLAEQTRFGNLIEISTASIKLLEIVAGSVQQEVLFCERDGRSTVESYRCHFHIHLQERFTFEMRLEKWSARKLLPMDAEAGGEGTADPFLQFSIKSSSSRSLANALQRGGYFGRTTTTEHVNNTLFPKFPDAKRSLYYFGTCSDLEPDWL